MSQNTTQAKKSWPFWEQSVSIPSSMVKSQNLGKKWIVKLAGHTYASQKFDKLWMWRSICNTRTYQFCCSFGKKTPLYSLEKGQLIQLGNVTRIKLALRFNFPHWPHFRANFWFIKIRTIHKLSLWPFYDFFWKILI